MAISRRTFEIELADRIGGWLSFVGKDVTIYSTPNPTFNGPLAFALTLLNSPPPDPGLVTDLDLSAISFVDFSRFCDLAEVRALRNAIQNCIQVTASQGSRSSSDSDILSAMQRRLTELETAYASVPGLTTISAAPAKVAPLNYTHPVRGFPEWGINDVPATGRMGGWPGFRQDH